MKDCSLPYSLPHDQPTSLYSLTHLPRNDTAQGRLLLLSHQSRQFLSDIVTSQFDTGNSSNEVSSSQMVLGCDKLTTETNQNNNSRITCDSFLYEVSLKHSQSGVHSFCLIFVSFFSVIGFCYSLVFWQSAILQFDSLLYFLDTVIGYISHCFNPYATSCNFFLSCMLRFSSLPSSISTCLILPLTTYISQFCELFCLFIQLVQ